MSSIVSGHSLLKAGNVSAARKMAQEVLDQANDYDSRDQAFDLLYQCYFYERDFRQADALARSWIAQLPESIRGHKAIVQGSVYFSGKKEARRAIDLFCTRFSHEKLFVKINEAVFDMRFGTGRDAENILQDLVTHYPDCFDYIFMYGVFAYHHYKYHLARTLFIKAINASPQGSTNAGYAMVYYAVCCFYCMRYAEARHVAQQVVAFYPELSHVKSIVWLCRLVYFPVFWCTALFFYIYWLLQEYMGVRLYAQFIGMMGMILIVLCLFTVVHVLLPVAANGAVNDAVFWILGIAMFLWICIESVVIDRACDFYRKVKSVSLKDY